MVLSMQAQKIVRISTDKTDLVYQVNDKNRIYQVYLGDKLLNPQDYQKLKWNVRPGNDGSMGIRGHEAYPASGGEDYFEPAVAIIHADGNQTTYLYYQSHEQRSVSGGTETVIRLADDKYKDEVVLHYVAYPKENVIKMWSEIINREPKPITLWRYNSGMLYFTDSHYYLTNYHSDWAFEGQPETQELKTGKKIVDTKLGTRANLLSEPFVELAFGQPAQENTGRVLLGNIGWTGNFQYTCEVDNTHTLRLIPGMVRDAKAAGVKFGIWVEPEMVNPKSELYEKHPDWAIELPNRDTYYYRNQLVLDLSNPQVQDFVFGVIDRIMTENPDVAYMKWDCNSPITNIYSHYLGKKQGNLYIDYVRGLYKVFQRVNAKYPKLDLMLCSGGGGRCDYEALKYFTEFWCSDDTDPFERLYIQWSMSKFFPAKSMASHVTNWNRGTSVKFRFDVCSMVKLGFDIDLKSLSANDYKFLQNAVAQYRDVEKVIFDGDQYRLVSPYETAHAALDYVSKDKRQALLYTYNLHPRFGEGPDNVRLQGLDPTAQYTIEEIYRMPGDKEDSEYEGQTFSGDFLMKVGLNVLKPWGGTSHVFKLTAK